MNLTNAKIYTFKNYTGYRGSFEEKPTLSTYIMRKGKRTLTVTYIHVI